jgi:hypothetical protein
VVVLALAGTIWFAPYLVQSEGRFVSRVLVGHYAPWYLGGGLAPRLGQLGALLANFLPWTVLLVAAATWWPRHPDANRRWVGAATATLAVIFALSGNQRARYLLPIYPGLALLVAEFVVRAPSRGGHRAVRIGAWAFVALAATAALVGPFFAHHISGDDRALVPDGHLEMAIVAALLVGAAVILAVATRQAAFTAGTAGAALAIAAIMILAGVTYPPRYARANDLRPLAATAVQHTAGGAPVVVYPEARLSLDFYVRRPVVETPTPETTAALASKGPSAVITTRGHWHTLSAVLAAPWRVAASGHVAGREFVVIVP